jgi:hypothetical protein
MYNAIFKEFLILMKGETLKILRSIPIICIGLLFACAGSMSRAHELVTNGDFELDIANGWSIDSVEGMTPYYDTLDRDTAFNPDPDYEARVKKYDSAHAKLYQIFDVATTDLAFGINAKLYAVEYNPAGTYFAAAAVVLSYMNSSGVVLGETRICDTTGHCIWASGPTLHLIVAPDSNWNAYSFNVNDELANLPGVNPLDIAKVRVALFDTTNGC